MFNILEIVSECSSPALGIVLNSLRKILNIIQIIVPIVLIVALTIHIIGLMSNPDDKKLPKKIQNTAIAAVIIFVIPILVNATMGLLDNTFTISACWNSTYKYTGSQSKYNYSENNNRKNIFTNPDDYESGVPKKNSSTSNGGAIEGTAKQIGDVVWDSTNLTRKSNLTSTQLVGILNAYGGNAKNFVPYASALITAENKYNVNVFFLLGVEALESGWMTSAISRNCNNLGGVCSSNSHPSNGCGKNYNCSFAYFNSAGDFIDYHAKMLNNNYLTPGGAYYHGATPQGVVTSYCPGCSDWPRIVIEIANGLFAKVPSVL